MEPFDLSRRDFARHGPQQAVVRPFAQGSLGQFDRLPRMAKPRQPLPHPQEILGIVEYPWIIAAAHPCSSKRDQASRNPV
jgi:hypothetical protein